MPNITTNHAITYTNPQWQEKPPSPPPPKKKIKIS